MASQTFMKVLSNKELIKDVFEMVVEQNASNDQNGHNAFHADKRGGRRLVRGGNVDACFRRAYPQCGIVFCRSVGGVAV